MSKKLDCREFFKNTTFSAAGIMLGNNLSGCTFNRESVSSSYDRCSCSGWPHCPFKQLIDNCYFNNLSK